MKMGRLWEAQVALDLCFMCKDGGVMASTGVMAGYSPILKLVLQEPALGSNIVLLPGVDLDKLREVVAGLHGLYGEKAVKQEHLEIMKLFGIEIERRCPR